jgi:hypothetical protein
MIFGLRHDWGLHFLVGMAARVAVTPSVFLILVSLKWPLHWAMAVSFISGELVTAMLAKLKENYDRKYPAKHNEDGWDAFWTQAGGTAGGVITLVLFALYYFFRS